MNFLDIFLAPGKKQKTVVAYSPEHREVRKEQAKRGSEW